GGVLATRTHRANEETRRRAQSAEIETSLALARQEATAIPELKAQIAALQAEMKTASGFASRCDEQERTIDALESRLETYETGRAVLQTELTTEKATAAAALAARDAADRAVEALRLEKDAQIAERDAFVMKLEARIAEVLGKAAGEVVQRAQEDFVKISAEKANDDLEKRQKGIDELIAPLFAQLRQLEETNDRIQQERAAQVATVHQQVERLQGQTSELANALRKPQTRGAWGEQQLQVLLENAGMVLGQDFTLQESTTDEERRLRADFVISLPHGRKLVIDCKTPFDAYMDAANAADEVSRASGMRRHSDAVRGHIKELSSKAYWSRHPGADCVVMFIPHEGAYIHALETDPSLIDAGRDARVYLASPNSILGIVHMARYILAEQRARDGADELRKGCRDLVERIGVVAGHMSAVGGALSSATAHYNKAVGSIDTRLLVTARNLERLGIDGAKGMKTPEGVTDGVRAFAAPELQSRADESPTLPLDESPAELPALAS
ncbi:DNA recombination protein RmuC, partial [bacterium]